MRFEDLIELMRRLYAGAPYPAALADDALRVRWANPPAALLLETETEADGTVRPKELFSPAQRETLLSSLRAGTPCTLLSADGDSTLALMPAMDGAQLAGCHIFSGQHGRLPGSPDARRLRHFVSACEKSNRLPLTIIFSTLSLLAREKRAPAVRDDYLNLIRQNCYRLLRSSNNLSASLALCAGQYKPETQNGDLAAFTARLHADIEPLLTGISIPITLQASKEPLRAAFDPRWVRRILLNLISNSCRFTREGNRITLRMRARDGRAEITVTDRGAGMPAVLLEQFRMEEQCGLPFSPESLEGSGLGLSLARQLAVLQGGALRIESEEGVGTEATLSLPLRRDEHAPEYLAQDGAPYLKNRFSDLYVELSDVCDAPEG